MELSCRLFKCTRPCQESIQHCEISSNGITNILLAGRNRLLLQSGDFKIRLQLLKALIYCCRHIYPLRHDLYIADQLGGIAAIAIRSPLVLELPLQRRLYGARK